MKKVSRFVMAFLLGAFMTTSFTACSDSNDNGSTDEIENPAISNQWTGEQSVMWEAANQYINNVIYPTYTDLATHAATLYQKALDIQTKKNAGTLTDDDIKAACLAFEDARRDWERSEAFLYGSATDNNIDPHMDSWPLDPGQVGDLLSNADMVAGLTGSDPIGFVRANNGKFDTALGFHGVEYVLFRNKAYRTAADFADGKMDESVSADDGTKKTFLAANEIPFLVAVTGDLRDHCYWLEVSWKGQAASAEAKARVAELGFPTHANQNNGYYYGADMLMAGHQYSSYNTIEAALVTIVGASGCGNICNEVQEQKLGQAWRVENGQGGTTEDGEKESAAYIESPYSGRSFIDYRDNLYSIKNSLYGNRLADANGDPDAKSILNYLKAYNYDGYNDLVNALDAAIQSLTDPINEGKHFVDDPGAGYVKNAMDKIKALNDQLINAANWIEKR